MATKIKENVNTKKDSEFDLIKGKILKQLFHQAIVKLTTQI